MSDALAAWMAGAVSAPVALARMVLAGLDEAAIAVLLPAGTEIALLFDSHRERLGSMAAMLDESKAGEMAGSVAAIGAAFDRAVALAPEASVAAYSLGDPSLLGEATDELVAFLRSAGVAAAGAEVIDVGCGIGRVAAALAPWVGSVLGTDVSAGMVTMARARCAGLRNVRFEMVDGAGRWQVADGSADLVLFVDSMPYLVQAGVAEAQVGEAARVMRAGGCLAVLNLSYRGGDADAHDAARWATRFGWTLRTKRPFRLWDGQAFLFQVPAMKSSTS